MVDAVVGRLRRIKFADTSSSSARLVVRFNSPAGCLPLFHWFPRRTYPEPQPSAVQYLVDRDSNSSGSSSNSSRPSSCDCVAAHKLY